MAAVESADRHADVRGAGVLPARADRLLLPDARLAVRGRGRRAGDDAARLARRRPASRAAPPLRSWLYRIATNVCLDMLERARSAAPGRWTSARRASPCSRTCTCAAEVTWVEPIPDPGRRRRRARDDPARLRRRAPAPAAAPARRADPLRGAALAGERGRRAARHERRVGEQRAPARPGDARRSGVSATDAGAEPDDGRARAARALRRRLRALRHRRADLADPRGRDPVDAAVRPVARGPRRHLRLVVRAGDRLPGLARDPDRRGERLAGVRAVQAERAGGGYEPWALQVLELSDGRIAEFTFFLDTDDAVPALRPAAAARLLAPASGRRTRSAVAARASAAQPDRAASRRAASCRRASASIVARSAGESAAASTHDRSRISDGHPTEDPVGQRKLIGADR